MNESRFIGLSVERWIPGVWFSDGSGTGVSPVCGLHDSHGRDARATTLETPWPAQLKHRLMSNSYPSSKSDGWKFILLRHETVLLLVLAFEWFYFNSIGPRFGTLDNTFDIVRHSVEIGLLALVMTPIILTGGIDLSVGSLLGLCAILFGKLWRDAGLPIPLAMACTLGIGAVAGGLNALLITWQLPPLIVTLGSYSLFRG